MHPESLLGLKRSGTLASGFVSALNGPVSRDRFGGFSIEDFQEAGIAIYTDEMERVVTVFLYREGRDRHAQYRGKLPFDLSFDSGRTEVIASMGLPESEGKGWDCFRRGSILVQVRYRTDLSVDLVSLMHRPEVAN